MEEKKEKKDSFVKSFVKNKIKIGIIMGALPFVILPLFLVLIISVFLAILLTFHSDGVASSGKKCVDVKAVSEVCSSISVDKYGTMSVDEYVAGVVQHEFGYAPDEVLKAQAVAARSYGINGASKDGNGNCSISDTSVGFQTFDPNPSERAIQAANDTSGMVLVDADGNITHSEYSSNSLPEPYDSYGDMITMSERDLEIPRSWFETNKTCDSSTLNTQHIQKYGPEKDAFGRNVYGCGHGRGLGQIASLYLATEKNYTFEEILDFFYGDESVYKWSLASTNGASSKCTTKSSSNFASLTNYNLDHEGLSLLNTPLSDSQMDDLNDYLEKEMKKNNGSYSDRVAAAGQSLVYWFEQNGLYLGYYWGGGHEVFSGANSEWGKEKWADGHGHSYYGMDCSGFVSWAIRTACPNQSGFSDVAVSFLSLGNQISLSEAKPGDVIASSGHVMLVVKNNGDGTVTVAEEGGQSDGLVFSTVGESRMSYGGRSVIDMSGWYESNCE